MKGRNWLKFVVKSKGIDKIFLTSFFALTTNLLNEINMRSIKMTQKLSLHEEGLNMHVFFDILKYLVWEKSN